MQGEAPDQVDQICAVESGVLGSLIAGGVGTMQAWNRRAVGHARPRCRRQGRACSGPNRLAGELGMRGRRPGPPRWG